MKKYRLLGIFVLLIVALWVDFHERPDRQIISKVLIESTEGYHKYISPLTSNIIRCKYSPSCSVYAVIVLKKEGVAGVPKILNRILSCR